MLQALPTAALGIDLLDELVELIKGLLVHKT